MKFTKTILLMFILLYSAGNSIAQELLDGIRAVINNEIILHSEVLIRARQTAIEMKLEIDPNDDAAWQKLYDEALVYLVDTKVIVSKAIEDSITVSEDQVETATNQRMSAMERRAGSREELEKITGQTYRKLKEIYTERMREEYLISQMKQRVISQVTVSRSEVEEFFEKNKNDKTIIQDRQNSYTFSHILKYPKPNSESFQKNLAVIKSISDRITAGEDFEALAIEFRNDSATGISSNDAQIVPKGEYIVDIENGVLSVDSGAVTQVMVSELVPLKTWGYHIFKNLGETQNNFRFKHIFFSYTVGVEDEAAYVDSLNYYKSKIKDGWRFEDVVAEHSDDEETNKSKGQIGTHNADSEFFNTFPEFKTAVQDLEVGEISEPFKTQYGYHLIKLSFKTTARPVNITEDWEYIKRLNINEKRQMYFENWIVAAKSEVFIDIKPMKK